MNSIGMLCALVLVAGLAFVVAVPDADAASVKLVWVGNDDLPDGWCDKNAKTVAAGGTKNVRFSGQMDTTATSQMTGKYRIKTGGDRFEWASGSEPSVTFTQSAQQTTHGVKAKSNAPVGTYTIGFVAVDASNGESATKTCKIEVSAGGGTTATNQPTPTLNVHASPASNTAPSDNKHRFTGGIANAFQDATTNKTFKFTVKQGTQEVATYTAPLTNGTTATFIKEPALPPGTYSVVLDVTVKKNQGAENPQSFSKTLASYVVPQPSVGYGWTTAVSTSNAGGLDVTTRLTSGGTTAEDTIAGHSISQIVRDANVKVRGDNKACQTCHTWAPSMSKSEFCSSKVTAFNGAGKPQILKDLFNRWKAANPSCRD